MTIPFSLILGHTMQKQCGLPQCFFYLVLSSAISTLLWFGFFQQFQTPTFMPANTVDEGNKTLQQRSWSIVNRLSDKVERDSKVGCWESPFVLCSPTEDPWRLARAQKQRRLIHSTDLRHVPHRSSGGIGQTPGSLNYFSSRNKSTINVAVHNMRKWMKPSAFDFSDCEAYKNCVFKGTKNSEDIDVLLVNGVGLDTYSELPRWPHQLMVLMAWENPTYFLSDLATFQTPLDNEFNLTMTYRLDSDIFVPYHRLLYNPKPLDQRPDYAQIVRKKRKKAIAMISHCDTVSGRDYYIKELTKHFHVDFFGRCGKPCPTSPDLCGKDIGQYRFLLSFENALCTDYVTEKYFNGFDHHVVPIVRGGIDYKKYFPPNTYIDTSDFDSPKALALYLYVLQENDDLYVRYIEAMDQYKKVHNLFFFSCELCKTLNTYDGKTKQQYAISTWFGDGHCHAPTDLVFSYFSFFIVVVLIIGGTILFSIAVLNRRLFSTAR